MGYRNGWKDLGEADIKAGIFAKGICIGGTPSIVEAIYALTCFALEEQQTRLDRNRIVNGTKSD